jgi:hypothetical protein
MNLLAFGIMYPASFILNPRWFHKVNVFMIRSNNSFSCFCISKDLCRVCAAPVLLIIGIYERHTFHYPGMTFYDRVSLAAERAFDSFPRKLRRLSMSGFLISRPVTDPEQLSSKVLPAMVPTSTRSSRLKMKSIKVRSIWMMDQNTTTHTPVVPQQQQRVVATFQ